MGMMSIFFFFTANSIQATLEFIGVWLTLIGDLDLTLANKLTLLFSTILFISIYKLLFPFKLAILFGKIIVQSSLEKFLSGQWYYQGNVL